MKNNITLARSAYGFKNSYGHIKDVVSLRGDNIALIDYNSTWGWRSFEKQMIAAGKNPLFGCTFNVKTGLHKKRSTFDQASLIAKNHQGIAEISNLVSLAFNQKHYVPLVETEQIDSASNCIVLDRSFQMIMPREEDKIFASVHLGRAFRDRLGLSSAIEYEIDEIPEVSLPVAKPIEIDNAAEILTARINAYDFPSDTYRARAAYELETIIDRGYASYILMVSDLIDYCKGNMLVGAGRGSAGGSLICYIMGITQPDPIKYGLLFERFLDKYRSDFLDIDIDISNRDLATKYLTSKYGKDNVSMIGAVGEYTAKSAAIQFCRSNRVSFEVMDMVKVENYPKGWHEDYPLFEQYIEDTVGMPTISSTHAAGVLVSNEPITSYCGIENGTAQITGKEAEAANLLKIDLLGLNTLSIISKAASLANVSLPEISDDQKTLDVFNSGKLSGIFQFGGSSVSQLTNSAKVERFMDLCDLTSLARPGALDSGGADRWIERRYNNSYVPTGHAGVDEVLESTLGVVVYQEQIMKLARVAGFSEKDIVGIRRAVGKKNLEVLSAMEIEFKRGITGELGEVLWAQIITAGNYAFNMSHAVAYSFTSFYCAWLQAYHPSEFNLARLIHARDDDDRVTILREMFVEGHDFDIANVDSPSVDWHISESGRLTGGLTNITGIAKKTAQKLVSKPKEEWGRFRELVENNVSPLSEVFDMYTEYSDWYANPESHGITKGIGMVNDFTIGTMCSIVRIEDISIRSHNTPEKIENRGNRMTGFDKYAILTIGDASASTKCYVSRDIVQKTNFAKGQKYLMLGEITENFTMYSIKRVKRL